MKERPPSRLTLPGSAIYSFYMNETHDEADDRKDPEELPAPDVEELESEWASLFCDCEWG